jgi:hypothetical protein
MAKFTRDEFADACGKTYGYVSTNIARGKLELDEDGLIDTSKTVNSLFLQRLNPSHSSVANSKVVYKPKKKTAAPSSKTKKTISKKNAKKKEDQHDDQESDIVDLSGIDFSADDLDIGGLSVHDLDRLKKKADIELKAESIKNKRLERAKLMGESLPTKAVKNLISQFSRQIIQSYSEKIEKLAIEFSHKHKLSADQRAELGGELKRMINKSHDDAVNETKKILSNLIKEVKNG